MKTRLITAAVALPILIASIVYPPLWPLFVLLAVAGVALRWLYGLHVPPQSAGLLAYGLGAVGYMAASSGLALVMLGRHLFDEGAISPRWGRG